MQPNTSDFTRGLRNLFRRVQTESPFVGYFLLRNHPADCVDEQLPSNFELPFLLLDRNHPGYVRGTGNSYILAIMCMKDLTDKDFLLKFAEDLLHIRTRRILAMHNRDLASSVKSDIVKFFQNCEQLKFLNVALIHRDFAATHIYHSFNQFPVFELETRDMRFDTPIYPNRLANAGGKALRTLLDQIPPTSMTRKDKKGAVRIAGYVACFIATFAEKYNFTLQMETIFNESAQESVKRASIRQALLDGTIDVGSTLLTPQLEQTLHECIYPVEFIQWVTMLPVEPPLETYQFFIKFFRPTFITALFGIFWLLCFLYTLQEKMERRALRCDRSLLLLVITPWNLDLMRGLFCQPLTIFRTKFWSRRIIFVLVIVLGGYMANLFSTNMVKWLTVPPNDSPIETFSQVIERGLQIQIGSGYVDYVKFFRGEEFWNKYNKAFKVQKTAEEYMEDLRKMNARYAYVMTTKAWPIYKQRQEYFTRPLFRLSEDLYYTKGSIASVPVSENSIYIYPLSIFYLRLREAGIISHWYDMTFQAMVEFKILDLKDLSRTRKHDILTLHEFACLLMAYGVGMGLSVIIFLFELYWSRLCGKAKAFWRQYKARR
ncbi:uncharacterized protein LOC118747988 [Rhagoletis pomonella]|uniref:uncharacterized protein LOC118747988 n=1 Tax=Rhagoletis pomonella TaxID=28610 RepID=UPI00177F1270|nr:uncharacterized protein LOC118747988 [Rhagoletis pomonella]